MPKIMKLTGTSHIFGEDWLKKIFNSIEILDFNQFYPNKFWTAEST